MPANSASRLTAAALVTFLGVAFPRTALAQATFFETFDSVGPVNAGQHGPSGLIAKGWQFKNQSAPIGGGSWYGTNLYSKEGSGCFVVESSVGAWANASSKASSWAILPAVANQAAGDAISFWLADPYIVSGVYGVLEVRYSPMGGTSTGSGPNDVGDFTQVLLSIPNVNGNPWTKHNTAVPASGGGAGRLALRYIQPPVGGSWQFQGMFSLDSLVVGSKPGNGFPIPNPGETVHWTLAMSPIVIDYDTEIPAGGKVIIDPNVVVSIDPTMRLDLYGAIEAQEGVKFTTPVNSACNIYGEASFIGTPTSKVQLLGGPAWFGSEEHGYQVRQNGRLVIDHAIMDALIKTNVYIYNQGGGTIIADHVTTTTPEAGFYADRGTLALRNSTMSNGGVIRTNDGYLLIDTTTLNNSTIQSQRYKAGQPVCFDNLTATGVTSDSPFQLAGYDHFFGPGNAISGNLYPVHLVAGGIAPGSTLPASGNTNNWIHAGGGGTIGLSTLSKTTPNLPYVVHQDNSFPSVGGRLTIDPGVTVRFMPGAYLWAQFGSYINIEGLPGQPITFEPFTPGTKWQTLNYFINSNRPKVEHAILRGMTNGLIADETFVSAESCVFENNTVGALANNYGQITARKSTFTGNTIGVLVGGNAGSCDLDGFTNANSFSGNTKAVDSLENFVEPGKYNWWGSNTGPKYSGNPGGQGDPITPLLDVKPWRFTQPVADTPPVVRMMDAPWVEEIGAKLILHWSASDNAGIVKQRLEFTEHDGLPLQLIADNIPPDARSWEVTIPTLAPTNLLSRSAFRVTAIDALNQEGWDETMLRVLQPGFKAGLPAKAVFPTALRPGQNAEACISKPDGTPVTGGGMWLVIDDLNLVYSLGDTGATSNCLGSGMTAPGVSTDLARLALRTSGGSAGFENWYFTPYFSIRPDAAINDAPPSVQMLTPINGQSFKGGTVVPISWNASDDEGVRSFEIQASYTGGKTWSTIVRDLPATQTNYAWKLPPIPTNGGIADVRLRILARDLRFQATSHGADRALAILPGTGGCYADCDQSGGLDIDDFICFQTLFALGDPSADCDASGALDIDDFICFQTVFAVGC